MNPLRAVTALLLGVGALAAATPAGLLALGDTRGDAGRGRIVFQQKRCAGCHLPRGQQGVGPPLEGIRKPQGVLELAGRLWNHAPAMFAVLTQQGLEWPEVNLEEMADLMAYLQADPSRDPAPGLFQGRVVLVRKGCLKCHRLRGEGGSVGIDLTRYHRGYNSPVAWATTIWNHSPRMAGHAMRLGVLYPRFTGDEMVNLVAFLKSATAAPSQ